MITYILKCGLLVAICPLLFACQQATLKAPAEFLVTAEQSKQLGSVINAVSSELSQYNYASFTDKKVSDALVKYDPQIQNILNQEQWTEYDQHQRDYWVYKIYTKMKRNYRSVRSISSISSAMSSDIADRTDGTFGLNRSNQ